MLHYRPRDEEEFQEARLGLVVGKKLLKAAVRRNLLKRLAREHFRRRRPELPACDLVIRLVAKPKRMDRKAIADEVAMLLNRLVQRLQPPRSAKTAADVQ